MQINDWDIDRKAKQWIHEKFEHRCCQTPEKIEFVGSIFTA